MRLQLRAALGAIADRGALGGAIQASPRGCPPGYYAAFYADPEGIKIEVPHIPESNS
jgi:hypothetical protein